MTDPTGQRPARRADGPAPPGVRRPLAGDAPRARRAGAPLLIQPPLAGAGRCGRRRRRGRGGRFAVTAGDSAEDLAPSDNPASSGSTSVASPSRLRAGRTIWSPASSTSEGCRRHHLPHRDSRARARRRALRRQGLPAGHAPRPRRRRSCRDRRRHDERAREAAPGRRGRSSDPGHVGVGASATTAATSTTTRSCSRSATTPRSRSRASGRPAAAPAKASNVAARSARSRQTGPAPWSAGTVTGTVTIDDGPAPGTTLPLTSGDDILQLPRRRRPAAGASIDPDGTYEIELPAGAYDIEVTSPALARPDVPRRRRRHRRHRSTRSTSAARSSDRLQQRHALHVVRHREQVEGPQARSARSRARRRSRRRGRARRGRRRRTRRRAGGGRRPARRPSASRRPAAGRAPRGRTARRTPSPGPHRRRRRGRRGRGSCGAPVVRRPRPPRPRTPVRRGRPRRGGTG